MRNIHSSKVLVQVVKNASGPRFPFREHKKTFLKPLLSVFSATRNVFTSTATHNIVEESQNVVKNSDQHEQNFSHTETVDRCVDKTPHKALTGRMRSSVEGLNNGSLNIITQRLSEHNMCKKKIKIVSQTGASFAFESLVTVSFTSESVAWIKCTRDGHFLCTDSFVYGDSTALLKNFENPMKEFIQLCDNIPSADAYVICNLNKKTKHVKVPPKDFFFGSLVYSLMHAESTKNRIFSLSHMDMTSLLKLQTGGQYKSLSGMFPSIVDGETDFSLGIDLQYHEDFVQKFVRTETPGRECIMHCFFASICALHNCQMNGDVSTVRDDKQHEKKKLVNDSAASIDSKWKMEEKT